MRRRTLTHLRQNVVAYIALFLALGMGTAWALERNSVRSKHIKDANVREADLGPLAVTPSKTDLVGRNFLGGTTTTTSTSPTPTSQPGPSVTVDVPADGLVAVYAKVDIRLEAGTDCFVFLEEDTDPPREIMRDSTNSFVTNYSAPGFRVPDSNNGIVDPAQAGFIVLAPGAGTHSYRLTYAAFGPSRNCSFTNRDLYVAVIG
jgi:hypothetical protein